MKFLAHNFRDKTFGLKDAKYEEGAADTVKNYCTLLRYNGLIKFCRYKQNPLDMAGCGLTNGKDKDYDTTKSKEVSNTINALHALGFVERNNRDVSITDFGYEFADAEYGQDLMQKIIFKAVLSYGPEIGILSELESYRKGQEFSINSLKIGYPNSEEQVHYNNVLVSLSSGSEKDSMTRTKSCLLAWLTAAGVIEPVGAASVSSSGPSHLRYRDFLNGPLRNKGSYRLSMDIGGIFKKLGEVTRPLDYDNLTKLTKALRENNQELIRKATLKYETVIKNRRFAILFLLNDSFKKGREISYTAVKNVMLSRSDLFVVNKDSFDSTLKKEMSIANIAGIPYSKSVRDGELYFHAKNSVNFHELSKNAPADVIGVLKSFIY